MDTIPLVTSKKMIPEAESGAATPVKRGTTVHNAAMQTVAAARIGRLYRQTICFAFSLLENSGSTVTPKKIPRRKLRVAKH